MNINNKLTLAIVLVSSCLLTTGCNTTITKNNVQGYNNMTDDMKGIAKIDFFAQDSDLFFILNLKNITNETISVNKSIKPFWIQHNDKSLEYKLISPSYPDGVKDQYVYIKPSEDESFVFKVNEMYQFLDGERDYELTYIDYFYDINHSGKIKPKYLTEINITWHKEPNSDQGTLISTDFDSKNNTFNYQR